MATPPEQPRLRSVHSGVPWSSTFLARYIVVRPKVPPSRAIELRCRLHMNERAAFYVNQILKGTKPSDLPVQLPVNINLVVNLKTAKRLGVEVPLSILVRADELIE